MSAVSSRDVEIREKKLDMEFLCHKHRQNPTEPLCGTCGAHGREPWAGRHETSNVKPVNTKN